MTTRIKLLLTLLMIAPTIMAQRTLTLEELLPGGKNFAQLQPENKFTTWWGDTPIETQPDEVHHAQTGKTLFTVEQLNGWIGRQVAHNGHNLVFPYPTQPLVLAQNTTERVLVDFERHSTIWRQPIPQGAQHQDWNAQSRHLAYTIQGNLYVSTNRGEELQVSTDGSTDGSDNIVYGTSVHRDEFGINKGTFWSPDGQKLAFYRMDQSMVPSYPQVDITTRIATTTVDHYPMAGETSHRVRVGIYDVAQRTTTWLQLAGGAEDYHTNISWGPDGKTIYILELNREQNQMQLIAYDTQDGSQKNQILTHTSPKYLDPQTGLTFLPWDHSKAIMQSPIDGYNHLYVLDVRTGDMRQLTRGEWEVLGMVGFDRKARSVIYLSNEGDPRRKCLHTVNVKTARRTPLGVQGGVHTAQANHSGTVVIDRYSSPTTPRSISLVPTNRGTVRKLLTAKDPWVEQGYRVPEISSGSIKAADGQTDLYYRMVKPLDFDPAKRYPTIVYVYGGPRAHNVQASWHWGLRGWEAHMAALGYVLFILDNRGSEWRGQAFEQATWHRLGQVEMEDQMQGVGYLRSLPFVDTQRMGVHGWSYGGFMTISLMLNHPDAFEVGVAGGPVIDWKYYEVMYGERYMGTPQNNPEGYKQTSLLNKAGNLKGRLQVICGYNDPTCVPQHTLSFIKACIDAGTQPDLFVYPGAGHNMKGREQIHLHERITRYFEDYLK